MYAKSWEKLPLHLLLLIAFSLLSFSLHPAKCFLGNDGPTAIALAQEQLNYFGISINLHTDFLKGLGNLSIPTNLSIMPPYWFSICNAHRFTPAASYACFAVFTFLSAWLIAWNFVASRGVRYAAAWLMTIIFMHYTYSMQIYAIAGGMPHITLVLFTTASGVVALWRAGRNSWWPTIGYAALLLAALFVSLITNPLFIVSTVPFLLLCALFSLFNARDRSEILRKFAACFLVLAIALLLGWGDYLLGLLQNNAFVVFRDEVNKPETIHFNTISILFQGGLFECLMGPWLFIAATLGAALALYAKDRELRLPALMLLSFQFLIAGVGGIIAGWKRDWLQDWNGPIPIYFEIPAFPFYALFAAYGVIFLLKDVALKFRRTSNLVSSPFISEISAALCIALLTLYIALNPYDHERSRGETDSLAVPPASSPITQLLEKTIGLHPGAAFAGRVLTIMPNENFRTQYPYFVVLNFLTGNDYQTTGLWLKNIPTLHEYSQLITPGFFWMAQRFLSAPGVAQIRNWTNFSALNLPILRLLGVRYILSTDADIPGATLRITLVPPVKEFRSLRLFELDGVNVAGISARDVVTVDTLDKVEAVMKSPGFDIATAVRVDTPNRPFTDRLTPAQASALHVEKGGFHLEATSSGKTLLILPIEFSRCMDFIPVSGSAPQAMRVDGALLGILFEKAVNVKFAMETGPFTHQDCRLRDYREFKAMMGAPLPP